MKLRGLSKFWLSYKGLVFSMYFKLHHVSVLSCTWRMFLWHIHWGVAVADLGSFKVSIETPFWKCVCPKLINDCCVGDKITTVCAHSGFSTGKALYFLCAHENAMKTLKSMLWPFFWSSTYNISGTENPVVSIIIKFNCVVYTSCLVTTLLIPLGLWSLNMTSVDYYRFVLLFPKIKA